MEEEIKQNRNSAVLDQKYKEGDEEVEMMKVERKGRKRRKQLEK